MIEERFGRLAANALLIAIGAAIFVVAIFAVWNFGVNPVVDAIQDTSGLTWADVRAVLLSVTILTLLVVLGTGTFILGGQFLAVKFQRRAFYDALKKDKAALEEKEREQNRKIQEVANAVIEVANALQADDEDGASHLHRLAYDLAEIAKSRVFESYPEKVATDRSPVLRDISIGGLIIFVIGTPIFVTFGFLISDWFWIAWLVFLLAGLIPEMAISYISYLLRIRLR